MSTTIESPLGAAGSGRIPAVESARTTRSGHRGLSPMRLLAFAILAVLAVSWLIPFLWALATSLKTETDTASTPVTWIGKHGLTLDAYVKVLKTGDVPIWAWNSLFTSLAITVVCVVVTALAAYAFSRMRFRGRRPFYLLIIASIIVPPQVLIVPLFYEMLGLHLVDTYWGIILPQVVQPVMVLILVRFFDQIPIELEDAARVDGAGRLRVFFSVLLPLSRPILAAVAIFVFVTAWNNFLWPFIVVNDSSLMTLPVGLQTVKSAYGIQYAQNMAMAILAALPLIIVFLFFQRQIIRGIATTGFGGQ